MRTLTDVRTLTLVILLAALLSGVHTRLLAQEDECEGEAAYHVGLGNAYYDVGSFAAAISSYTCALELDPDYAPAYIERGYAYAAQSDFKAAFADYERALELDDSLVTVYVNRGLSYALQGNYGLAITDFDLVVALDPYLAAAYHNRAVVHAAEGNYDLAIVDFQSAIAADPDYPDPHAGLAAVYSALAAVQYEQFFEKAGSERAPLPAGSPSSVIQDVISSRSNGTVEVWLRLLNPAR
jgi:tetratricopeptide (TPR) repeat protein